MSESPSLPVKRLHADAVLPVYKHPGDAGMDLSAVEAVTVAPGEIVTVPTGLAFAIPDGYVGLVHPRSGLASRGLTVANAPGTIDAGYRGEVKVLLINLGREIFAIEKGDRIAQMVIQQVAHLPLVESANLDATPRGSGGFGSTGLAP
jgi:dUTP pyrophosphatase